MDTLRDGTSTKIFYFNGRLRYWLFCGRFAVTFKAFTFQLASIARYISHVYANLLIAHFKFLHPVMIFLESVTRAQKVTFLSWLLITLTTRGLFSASVSRVGCSDVSIIRLSTGSLMRSWLVDRGNIFCRSPGVCSHFMTECYPSSPIRGVRDCSSHLCHSINDI